MKKWLPVLILCGLLCGCGLLDIATPRASETPAPVFTAAPSPTPVPAASATAVPDPTSASSPAPESTPAAVAGVVTLKDAGSVLYARVGPGKNEEAAGVLENGAVVAVLEDLDGWYEIRFGERELYASSEYIALDPAAQAPGSDIMSFYMKPSSGTESVKDPSGAVDESGNPVMIDQKVTDTLVDVGFLIPEAEIVMIFSTADNFTGVAYYPEPVCLLQAGTAQKLKRAAEMFAKDGYTLRIYDAYRPLSVQRKLFEYVGGDRTYIASPEVGSKHNRGAAVDVTLVDGEGNELEMPSPIHTMNVSSARNNPNMTQTAKANMDYMTRVMEACGFTSYNGEWWHFNDADWAGYMLTDHDLSKVMPFLRKAG